MSIDTISPRTRRAFLFAGLGAVAATVANALGRPVATEAAAKPVLLAQVNPATGTTSINTNGPVAFTAYSAMSVGIIGESRDFRGGLFSSDKAAQVRLNPSALTTHPASGSKGDLFVDRAGNLWYCKGGTKWIGLA
jgi:hypothetical protein